MKISIITVTYNSAKVLKDCINSVVNQKYNMIEHIMIDGASTDSTMSILKKNQSHSTKLISEPDKGIYDAFNKGLKLAKGKCDLCTNFAPFMNKENLPYLEEHHIKSLSKGGDDLPSNCVALCPNCHRKMHSLDLESDVNKLKSRIKTRDS